jgi:parallel beta-helix repeat protein
MPRSPTAPRRFRPVFDLLEGRIAPAAYTINDPGTADAANPKVSAVTAHGTITLRSASDRASQIGGSMDISFSGPMTINDSFSYMMGPVTMNGIRQGNAPGVTIVGIIAIGSGGDIHDMHVLNAPGSGIYCRSGNTIHNNVIEGCGSYGICVVGSGNKITGNYVGVGTDGTTINGNQNGILLYGPGNTVGGTTAADRNVVSGNNVDGIQLLSSGGSAVANNCVVIGNYIGLSADGNTPVPNEQFGITVQGNSNQIGGLGPGQRNVVDAAGQFRVGLGGIQVLQGGAGPSSGNRILGNFVGTTTDGQGMFTAPTEPPDGTIGIEVDSNTLYTLVQQNTVADFAIGIDATGGKLTGTQIVGNNVGVSADGQTALRNKDGILLDEVSGVRVGGSSAGTRNIISGNTHDGIVIDRYATQNQIYGNYIGTNFAGDNLGNGVHAVEIKTGTQNFIGFTSKNGTPVKSYANTIAFNGFDQAKLMTATERGHAIQIDADPGTTGNAIRGNIFHDNKGLSIYLEDPAHVDELPQNHVAVAHYDAGLDRTVIDQPAGSVTGANNLQNYPVFTGVSQGQMVWELNTNQTNASYTIDFYVDDKLQDLGYGQGNTYLLTRTLLTDSTGHGKVMIPLKAGQYVCATATDPQGDTSDFSIVDTRGDGIADAWINKGIDFDMTGSSILTLPGASLTRMNLFLQMDVMSGVIGNGVSIQNVFNKVATAFSNAPVTSPMGGFGVNLQIDPAWGPQTVPFAANYTGPWSEFEVAKDAAFGPGLNDVQKKAAAMVYRYGIFINHFGNDSSTGLAEATIVSNKNAPNGLGYEALGGNEFMVALPSNTWSFSPTPLNTVTEDDLAGTMMHELGHTLGLMHGGNSLDNYKPNYYSVMNYTWQMPGLVYRMGAEATDYSSSWSLDYSRSALRPLNESATGFFNIGFDTTKMVPISQVWQEKGGGFSWAGVLNQLFHLVPMSGYVPRLYSSAAQARTLTGLVDLNYDGFFDPKVPPQLTTLTGAADWFHLIYNFRESPSYRDGQHGVEANEANLQDFLGGPPPVDYTAAGSDTGSPPRVQVFNPNGSIAYDFAPFSSSFTGGVRVAVGDVNGDGTADIIATMGPGGDTLAVFDGTTGNQIYAVQPYGVGFTGGMNVAAGDVDGSGKVEIIVAPASGTGSNLEVLDGGTGAVLKTILGFSTTTKSGVTLAAGDVNGDGKMDIIAGMASGSSPQVKVFDETSGKVLQSFSIGSSAYNGVFLAAADLDGDGHADIIAGTGAGPHSEPLVTIYSGAKPGSVMEKYYVDDPSFHGGVRVGVVQTATGAFDVLTATGPGKQPTLSRFGGLSVVESIQTTLFDNTFSGAFVA